MYHHYITDYNNKNQIGGVRRDNSNATVMIKIGKPISRSKANLQQKEQSHLMMKEVNAVELNELIMNQRKNLQQMLSSATSNTKTRSTLHNELSIALQDCHDRGVQQFVDWYLSYGTTYKLVTMATKSAAKHLLTINKKQSLSEQISLDLIEYMGEKYNAIVLRPNLTNGKNSSCIYKYITNLS